MTRLSFWRQYNYKILRLIKKLEGKRAALFVSIILIHSFIQKAKNLDTFSLSFDEIYSINFSKHNSYLSIITGQSYDIGNPPLYPVLLKLWMSYFGEGVNSVRFLSVFFFVLSLLILFDLCKKVLRFTLFKSVITLVFFNYSSQLAFFSITARSYSLLIFLSILTFNLFFSLIYGKSTAKRKLMFVLTVVAGLYTHYTYAWLLLLLFSATLIVPRYQPRDNLRAVIKIIILGFLLCLPWYILTFVKYIKYGPYEFYQLLDYWGGINGFVATLTNGVFRIDGRILPNLAQIMIFSILFISLVIKLHFLSYARNNRRIFFIYKFISYFMVMYLFTPIHNYLSNFKYIVLFTPFLIIVFVNIFVWWKNGFLTGILILFLFLYVGNAGYNQQVEHWKLLSDYLNKGDSKDVIIIGNSFARTALEYYYSGDMPVECAWEINGYSNCQSGIDSLAKYERIYYIKSWFGAKEIEPDIPYFSTNFILVGQETKIYSPASVWIFQNKNLNINPV